MRFGGLLVGCFLFLANNLLTIIAIANDEKEGGEEEIFQLPAPPPPADSENNNNGETKKLIFGEKMAMDELGPIIVNPDGTLRRIANWNDLTKAEQDSTFRQIAARNKRRMEALKEEEEKEKENDNGDVSQENLENLRTGEE